MPSDTKRTRYQSLLRELDQATRQLAGTAVARDDLQTKRAEAVVEISNLGVPRSVVAKLTGLTRGRVQQILDGVGASGVTGTEWDDPKLRQLVEAAIAARPLPSVGVGLRRESTLGPHLGQGWGGAIRLTGDVEQDRDEVIGALQRVLERARSGDFDELLTLTDEERDVIRGRLVELVG
jgi:hypothetical protein